MNKSITKCLLVLLFLIISNLSISQDNIVFDNYKLISDISNLKTVEGLAGNRNGNIDFGEKITMQIGLKALTGDFISTSIFVSSQDPYITVNTSKINYDDIKQGVMLYGNENLVIDISMDAPHLHRATISLEIMDSRKRDVNGKYIIFKDNFTITIHRVGPIRYGGAVIDDDNIGQSQGNNNMVIEKSDGRIEIPLFLKNIGKATVTAATVKLISNRNYVTILEDTHQYDFITSSGDGSTPSDYVFYLNDAAPTSVPYLPMKLEISGKYEGYNYKWTHEFRLGQFFGKLNVEAEPADAEILINKKFEGKGIVNLTKAPIDDFYEITVNRYGYQSETTIVPVKEGVLTEVYVTLAKNAEKKLDLPILNLVKWEYYYEKPYLLPESKKVIHGGFLFGGLGMLAAAYPMNIAASNSDKPGGSIVMANVLFTLPGIYMLYFSFTKDGKKIKKLENNINKNIIAIGEQQRIAREKAEKVNQERREDYYRKREEIEKRNAEIERNNLVEQAKRNVEYRVGNGSLIKVPNK